MAATTDIAIVITAKDKASPEVKAAGSRIREQAKMIGGAMTGIGVATMGMISIIRKINPALADALKPLDVMAKVLVTIGPLLMFVSSAAGVATIAWIRHTAAVTGSTIALIANRVAALASLSALSALGLGITALLARYVALAAAAVITAKAMIFAAAATIWGWASAIPYIGIGIAIAGVAALAASIWAIRGKLTALAEGGIITKPTLALVGERGPEAVLPLKGGASMLVGERGPEAVLPLKGGASMLARQDVRININIGSWLGDREGIERLTDKIIGSLRARQRLALGKAQY